MGSLFCTHMNKTTQPIRSQSDRDKISAYLLRKNVRDYALFMLGIFTGRRISDLVALDVCDVAYIDKRGRFTIKTRLQIREHKTGKYSDLILHPAARRALSKYLHKRKRDSTWAYLLREPLFKSQKRRVTGELRITKHYVWWILKSAAQACEINYKIGTHTLRKTFGYMLYRSGTNIEVIQKAFNHSSPVITLAYIGITQDDLDEAILSMD